MIRPLALVLAVVTLAGGGWWLLRTDEIVPAPSKPAVAAPTASAPSEVAAASPVEASVRSVVVSAPEQPPIPADAKWLDVLVVDAVTSQPVVGADVWWATEVSAALLAALPEKERIVYHESQELFATRFGWRTRSDGLGKVRIAAGESGADVQAAADGRYTRANIGGPLNAPPPGGASNSNRITRCACRCSASRTGQCWMRRC